MAGIRVLLVLLSILSSTVVDSLGTSADASFQNELLDRIRALEKQGQHHADEMQAMQSRLEEQDQRLLDQERTISDYKQRFDEQDQRLVDQERTINDLKQRFDEQDQRLVDQERVTSDYKQRMADLEQTVAELKLKQCQRAEESVESNADSNIRQNEHVHSNFRKERQMRALFNPEGPVAFHAIITANEVTHIGVNQKIVFPVVMTNLGGGYHVQHGLFIAPQPGVYIFSTTIMSHYSDHVITDVNIMKNGQVLARAYAHGDSGHQDQGSVTVVTQLATADEVWVSLYGPADTSLYGNYYDSFMGCLIFTL